ncbi:PP2C family protein-serine/threonine phosphatase [Streptomyces sp. NPDC002845]
MRGRRPRPWLREAVAENSSLARLLSVALIVLGAVLERITPPDITVTALFAAAPMVAAPLLSARFTAFIGLVSTLVLMALLAFYDKPGVAEGLTKAVTVATVAVLALFINRIVRRGRERLASTRTVAEAVQLAVLPTPPPRVGRLEIAARYEAAHSDARIGGDLYAVQETPHGVRLLVGDVRGKGLDAIEAVAVIIGTFREAADDELSLERVAVRLDHVLTREAERQAGLERFEGFTTALLAEVWETGKLRLVNRGHPAPLLLGVDGDVQLLEPSQHALPLGLGGLRPASAGDRSGVVEATFPPGATLLLYTDGLTEARAADGTFYDPAARARAEDWALRDPGDLLDALLADVGAYTGGRLSDDMALLAVARTSSATETGAEPPVSGRGGSGETPRRLGVMSA